MEIGFLLLTDHSEALNGKLYAMGGGWNMLRFNQLPVQHVFGIAFGVDVNWDEANQRHTIELETQDPDGERLGDELSFEIEVGRPPGSVTGQDQRVVVSIQANAAFSKPGPHAVVVSSGERELGRSRFYVVEIPPDLRQT
jgi:hypothetical protein